MAQNVGRHRPRAQHRRHVLPRSLRCEVQRPPKMGMRRLRPRWRHQGCSQRFARKARERAKELALYRHCRTGYPPSCCRQQTANSTQTARLVKVLLRRGVGHEREAATGVPMARVYRMSFSTAAKVLTVACAPGEATEGAAITAWAANAVHVAREFRHRGVGCVVRPYAGLPKCSSGARGVKNPTVSDDI